MGSFNVVPNMRNALQTPLYDTKSVAASASTTTKIQFFANTRAANGLDVTNLKRANQLEQGEKFTCYGISFEIVQPDLASLYKNFALQFILSGKVRWEGPVSMLPAGGGIHAAVTTTATTTTIVEATNGLPSVGAVEMFAPDLAIIIEGGQHFSAELVATTAFTATAAMFMRVYLRGVLETLVS
jgi:hypothetical protein